MGEQARRDASAEEKRQAQAEVVRQALLRKQEAEEQARRDASAEEKRKAQAEVDLRMVAEQASDRKKSVYKMTWQELKKLAKDLSISTRNSRKSGKRNKRAKGSKKKNELVKEIIAKLAERRV